MKKLSATVLLGGLVAGGGAYADYECTDFSNEVDMVVKENHFTHLGNASVTLTSESGTQYFFGKLEAETGVMMKKKHIEFYPFDGESSLTIVSQPQFCGRGGCDHEDSSLTTADLKLGEEHTQFSCNPVP